MKTQQVTLTRELSGRVAARLIAEVRPQVGGIIRKRLFTEGADVKAGDVLYQIDPAVYQAAYDGAQAAWPRRWPTSSRCGSRPSAIGTLEKRSRQRPGL